MVVVWSSERLDMMFKRLDEVLNAFPDVNLDGSRCVDIDAGFEAADVVGLDRKQTSEAFQCLEDNRTVAGEHLIAPEPTRTMSLTILSACASVK